ncbi:MAG: hypothetical protein V4712_17535 [Pseudomonadota bacterium]
MSEIITVGLDLAKTVFQAHPSVKPGVKSGRGQRYMGVQRRGLLADNGITCSMSRAGNGRCCTTLIGGDSKRESMRLDRLHKQGDTRPLPHDELVQQHCFAS